MILYSAEISTLVQAWKRKTFKTFTLEILAFYVFRRLIASKKYYKHEIKLIKGVPKKNFYKVSNFSSSNLEMAFLAIWPITNTLRYAQTP